MPCHAILAGEDEEREAIGACAQVTRHGAVDGLNADPTWNIEGGQEGAAYGFAVSTAGDVNGDGYSDLIVGAPTYNDNRTDEGSAFVYLGNGGGGLPVRPRQLRVETPLNPPHGGEATPIAPLGRSNFANRVRLQLTARSPLGREAAAFQWQLAPRPAPSPPPPWPSPNFEGGKRVSLFGLKCTGFIHPNCTSDLRPECTTSEAAERWQNS